MYSQVFEFEKNLQKEKEIYQEIYTIEEEKVLAISEKKGSELEKLSMKQEKLLSSVMHLEDERERLITEYIDENRLKDISSNITLKKIVTLMDEDSSSHLTRLGIDLKNLLLRLKDLQLNNDRMLNDNLEFYNLLLSGLKDLNKIDTGYGSTGKEEGKVSNPLLFNQTA